MMRHDALCAATAVETSAEITGEDDSWALGNSGSAGAASTHAAKQFCVACIAFVDRPPAKSSASREVTRRGEDSALIGVVACAATADSGAWSDACIAFVDFAMGVEAEATSLLGNSAVCFRTIHARIEWGTGFPMALSTVSGMGAASAKMHAAP